mmetsp:Transcript_117570/g.379441  ORF Transcript_117570/g.379441 Transcript_117570/m.379441 type:complete len:503 (+) Transcript_117570:109-1617(+)
MASEQRGAEPCDHVALGTDQEVVHQGTVWKLSSKGDPKRPESWVRRRMWLTAAGGLFHDSARNSAPCGCHVGGIHVHSLPRYLEDRYAFEVRPPGVGAATTGVATVLAVGTAEERDTWLRHLASFEGVVGDRRNLSPFDIYGKGPPTRRRSFSSLEAKELPLPAAATAAQACPSDSEDGLYGDEPLVSPQSSMGAASASLPMRCVRRNSQSCYAEKLHTSLLLDWDDTIFPTTWVRRDCGMNWRLSLDAQLEPGARRTLISTLLDKLLDRAVEFISEASTYANIFIVTLARRPWVEMSLQNFLPKLKGVIEALSLKVIYAQEYVDESMAKDYSEDEFKSSDEVMQFWTRVKGEAIARELDELHKRNDTSWKNIISLGDSDFERYGTMAASEDYMRREMEGGKVLCTDFTADGHSHTAEGVSKDGHLKRVRTKTVKMLSEPTVEELTAELALLKSWLPHMVRKDCGFDIELDCTDDDERLRELHKQVTGEYEQLSWEELAGMK